ncbi:MAG: DinB family protein [Candidatus Limnocylindrales bacterium]
MDELIARVREILATTPDRWRGLTATVPAGLLERRPAPGEWSALECLQHLLDTERSAFSVRLVAFREKRDFPAFDPDAPGSRPEPGSAPADLAAKFAAARVDTLKALDAFSASDLELTARHSELGLVTLREMLNEWAAHDLMHTVQAERALMQPFIAGSGKWRGYFTDHDVDHKS